MNVGIVTTWFERGAAYVSRQYLEALRSDSNNSVYIYARGGESYARNQSEWDRDFVTWGKVNKKYYCGATGIEKKDFIDWLKNEKKLSSEVAGDTLSRIGRAKRILDFGSKDCESYLKHLRKEPHFENIVPSVQAQIRRAIRLYFEYISEHKEV